MQPDEIRQYQIRCLEAGRCVQCCYPWHDGMCRCQPAPTPAQMAETDQVERAAFRLGDTFLHDPRNRTDGGPSCH